MLRLTNQVTFNGTLLNAPYGDVILANLAVIEHKPRQWKVLRNMKRRKRNLTRFRPPKPNILALACAWFLKYLTAALVYRCWPIVEFRNEDLVRLRHYHNSRVVFVPNHPDKGDPVFMFHLSNRIGQRFYHLANREIFENWWGLYGALLQACNAYSILRGTFDRHSFQMTRDLIAKVPNVKLCAFPEGANFSRSDRVYAFQKPFFTTICKGVQDLQATAPGSPVFLCPVAISYAVIECSRRLRRRISNALNSLEREVGLPVAKQHDYRERLRIIGDRVISRYAAYYALNIHEDLPIHDRLQKVLDYMVTSIANRIGVTLDRTLTFQEQLRKVCDTFHKVDFQDAPIETFYDERLLGLHQDAIQGIRCDVDRLENWASVERDYISKYPSFERVIDTIQRIEREVYGGIRLRPWRKCIIRMAEPFDICELSGDGDYTNDAVLTAVTERAEQSVQGMLDAMHIDPELIRKDVLSQPPKINPPTERENTDQTL